MPKKAPEKIGSVLRVPLSQLHPHPKNPFAVRDDSAMQELKESVSQNGVLVPAIARPRAEGGYELIAGHRRKYACEQAGQDFMPVIVLNLNDDEAVRRFITMNKIEKLNESIRALFRSEGEKFCYTPGEIERLVCSLNYKRLYSVLCDTAEPVYVCCAGGGICDSHQYHSTKLFPANATLTWSDEGEPLGDDNISTSYSNELWLLEDMTIAATSCFRVLNSAASYITEYREYKGDEWPAHLVPVNILELWQSLIDKYQDCGDEELDATLKAIIYEP